MRFTATSVVLGAIAAQVVFAHGGKHDDQEKPGHDEEVVPSVTETPKVPAGVTSTAFATRYTTIISCEATVTNCPASSTVVHSSLVPLTTATVYTTRYNTITSCAPTKTNCPANEASIVTVTSTEPIGVTICPVDELPEATPTPPKDDDDEEEHDDDDDEEDEEETPSHSVPYGHHSSHVPSAGHPTGGNPPATDAPFPTTLASTHKPTGVAPTGGVTPTANPDVPTAGASTLGASAVLAVVAGALALFA